MSEYVRNLQMAASTMRDIIAEANNEDALDGYFDEYLGQLNRLLKAVDMEPIPAYNKEDDDVKQFVLQLLRGKIDEISHMGGSKEEDILSMACDNIANDIKLSDEEISYVRYVLINIEDPDIEDLIDTALEIYC